MRRIFRDLLIAAVMGLVLLGISHLPTRQLGLYSAGFPIPYSYYVSGCTLPRSACRAYDPLLVVLDYFFWLAIATVVIVENQLRSSSILAYPGIGPGLYPAGPDLTNLLYVRVIGDAD